ncbi:MAG: protein RfbP, partial [Desulfobacterales bacterium]
MLKEYQSLILNLEKALDIAITGAAFILSYFIKKYLLPGDFAGLSVEINYYTILFMVIIIWYICFNWMDMYLSYREHPFAHFFTAIVKSCVMGIFLLTIIIYALHISPLSRLFMGIFLILNIGLLTLSRFMVFKTLQILRRQNMNIRNIVIIGTHTRAREVIQAVESKQQSGYRILGCFDTKPESPGTIVHGGHKVIGVIDHLEAYLKSRVVDEIIFAMPLKEVPNAENHIAVAENMGIKVRIIPDWELHYLGNRPTITTPRVENFLGIYTLKLQSTPHNEGALLIKALFDAGAAAILIILFLPLFICIAVAIKCFSPGPVLYSQIRQGKNGRKFSVLKFRTMVANADELRKDLETKNEADGPAFKIKNDPRIIPGIGTFLRKTSLDELPQLFNVLRGEMSLVGPRPPIPGEVDQYVLWQRRRLSMKPGITCLWQITPKRNDLSFEQWMKLDLQYIDTWSLFNDMKILLL